MGIELPLSTQVSVRRPAVLTRVLGIAYRAIETFQIRRAGQTRNTARSVAVTLIQRFGSALNLYIHLHMLFLDGVYLTSESPLAFRRPPPPDHGELQNLVDTISRRVGAYLEREGLLVRDMDDTYLQLDHASDSAIDDLISHSITYRIALGAGRKAFTLQTVPARHDEEENPQLARTAGFSLHAGVAPKARASVPVY